MSRKLGKRTLAVLAGGVLVSGPAIAACSSGPTYDQWAATDGAAGRINLDAVQEAYKESKSATEFEKRVNRIYEGDGIILIRASQDGSRQMVEAFEDLNGNGQIEDSTDDLLFSITENNNQNEIRGYGANGYYHHGFGGGSFLFGYLVASTMFGPRYYYSTPPGTVGTIRNDRTNYRQSPLYRSQVSRNSSYFSRQKTAAGSRYTDAGRNLSSSRQSYMSNKKATGAFRTSGTGVRSSWGSSSRSSGRVGGFGGARGFGGGQPQIAHQRGRRVAR